MKKLISIFGIFLLTSGSSTIDSKDIRFNTIFNDTDKIEGVLIASKIHGECSLLTQILTFQDIMEIPRVDEFLRKFFDMEMNRLNTNKKQYIELCQISKEWHTRIMEIVKNKQKSEGK